jgi:chemotaxis protein MotA
MQIKEIMVQGILSIQSGDNPRILEDKLLTFLPPSDRPAQSTMGE